VQGLYNPGTGEWTPPPPPEPPDTPTESQPDTERPPGTESAEQAANVKVLSDAPAGIYPNSKGIYDKVTGTWSASGGTQGGPVSLDDTDVLGEPSADMANDVVQQLE